MSLGHQDLARKLLQARQQLKQAQMLVADLEAQLSESSTNAERALEDSSTIPGESLTTTFTLDAAEGSKITQEMRQNELPYRSIVNAISQGVVLHAADGTIQSCNAAAERILGLTSDEMRGLTSIDPRWRAVHEDGSPFPGETHPAMVTLRTGQPVSDVVMGVHKPDGTISWIIVNSQPIFKADGQRLAGIVATFVNITEHKRADELVWESEALLAEMSRLTKVGGWKTDVETQEQSWTEEMYRIHELEPTHTPTVSEALEFYAPSSRPIIEQAVQRAVEYGEPYDLELEFITAKGNRRWVHTIGRAHQENGKTKTLSGMFQDITERKQAEEALQASEAKFRLLTEKSVVGKYILQDMELVYVNPSLARLFGYTPQEIVGKLRLRDLVHPDDLPIIAQRFQQRLEGQVEAGSISYRGFRKDGSQIHFEVFGVLIEYQGKPAVMGTLIDVTERKRAEAALAEDVRLINDMRLFLQTTLDALPANTVVLDPDGIIINANASWIQYAQKNGATSPTYFVGTNYLTVCDTVEGPQSHDAGLAAAGIRAVIAGLQDDFHLEYPCHSPTEKRWFALQVIPFPEAAPRRVVVTHHNITQHKEAENALRESEARFRMLIEAAPLGVTFSRAGVTTYVNAQYLQIFGYEHPEEMIGHPIVEFIAPQHREEIADLVRRGYTGESVLNDYESIGLRKDGSQFPFAVWVTLMNFADGPASVAFLSDISERKKAEEVLREQSQLKIELEKERELNELKTRFVSMVSHDFRTPLAVIKSSAEILRNYYPRLDEDSRARHFEKIETQIQRMIALLDDVLTVGRADARNIPFNPELMDVDLFCRQIVDELNSDPDLKHTIEYVCSTDQKRFAADEKLLLQALTNLLTNAIKYSPEGGIVRLELSSDSEYMQLRISDQGIGIPQNDLPRLFDPFHRAQNVGTIQGTGLGLAIVKRVVEIHKGTIHVESQEGVGTTFTVKIPVN
jgi:PAS domain S-box-containing protein